MTVKRATVKSGNYFIIPVKEEDVILFIFSDSTQAITDRKTSSWRRFTCFSLVMSESCYLA